MPPLLYGILIIYLCPMVLVTGIGFITEENEQMWIGVFWPLFIPWVCFHLLQQNYRRWRKERHKAAEPPPPRAPDPWHVAMHQILEKVLVEKAVKEAVKQAAKETIKEPEVPRRTAWERLLEDDP